MLTITKIPICIKSKASDTSTGITTRCVGAGLVALVGSGTLVRLCNTSTYAIIHAGVNIIILLIIKHHMETLDEVQQHFNII